VALPAFTSRTPLLQQSIDISCPPGLQQQTCSSGRTDGRTGTVPFRRPCSRILCGQCQLRTDDDDNDDDVETQAFSCDKYARHRLLGEAEFRLADVDLHREEIVRIWLNLHEIDEVCDSGLQYCPFEETVVIIRAPVTESGVKVHLAIQ